MVVCLERGADLHMAQLMPLPLTVSCFSKIQIGFTFLVPAHLGSPGHRAVKRVCVCLCNGLASVRQFVHWFVPSIDSSNGSWRLCCSLPASAADMDRLLRASCCRHWHSAANLGSVMLRVNERGSTQTFFTVRFGCKIVK